MVKVLAKTSNIDTLIAMLMSGDGDMRMAALDELVSRNVCDLGDVATANEIINEYLERKEEKL